MLFYILLLITIATILSYIILKLIYRKIFKSQKKVSKILVFLGSVGLLVFYYTPYSSYLQPSFWEFRKVCKMHYDFYENGIGSEEDVIAYLHKYTYKYKSIGGWPSGRYYPTIHALLYGLKWDEIYINCSYFYSKWDKDYYDKLQRDEVYEK